MKGQCVPKVLLEQSHWAFIVVGVGRSRAWVLGWGVREVGPQISVVKRH